MWVPRQLAAPAAAACGGRSYVRTGSGLACGTALELDALGISQVGERSILNMTSARPSQAELAAISERVFVAPLIVLIKLHGVRFGISSLLSSRGAGLFHTTSWRMAGMSWGEAAHCPFDGMMPSQAKQSDREGRQERQVLRDIAGARGTHVLLQDSIHDPVQTVLDLLWPRITRRRLVLL